MTEADWIIVWGFRDAFPWHLAIGPAMVAGSGLLFYVIYLGYFAWVTDVLGTAFAWFGRIYGYPMIILVFVAGLVGTYFSAIQFFNQRSAFTGGDYVIAEGIAEVINPSPSSPEQQLEVGGETFVYSVRNGFSTFAGHFTEGGIVRTGMTLRISHIDGAILRVERREQPQADST